MDHRKTSPWRWLGWLLLLTVLALAVTAAVSLAIFFNELPSDLLITIDGEQVDLGGLHPGHAWLAFGGLVLAAVIVVVVVPLALLFGLGVPLVITALALMAALLVAGLAIAVVGSPLILVGLLMWWALRPKKPAAPAAPRPPAAPPPVPVIGQHTDNSTPFVR
jgi:hypothetical protein